MMTRVPPLGIFKLVEGLGKDQYNLAMSLVGGATLGSSVVVTGSGAPQFYMFLMPEGQPTLHESPHEGLTLLDFELQASDESIWIDVFPGPVFHNKAQEIWWGIYRNPGVHPGTSIQIPLRQFPIGTGTRATSFPQGWTHDDVAYNSSGAPVENGYGPHPTETTGYTLEAIAATIDGTSYATLGAYTWNNKPTLGASLTTLTFAAGQIDAYPERPDAYTLTIPVASDATGIVLRIINHTPSGSQAQTYPAGDSSPFAFSRAGTVVVS